MKNIQDIVDMKLPVFPCYENGKKPLTQHGFKDASSNPATIREFWKKYPNANIGLPTGLESNLFVIDIDVKNGQKGLQSLAELEEQFGIFHTKRITTPSGGLHLYFRHPNVHIKNHVGILEGIDIRTEGAYVLAPGSVIDGKEYVLQNDCRPVELPQELIKQLASENTGTINVIAETKSVTEILQGEIEEGSRNHDIFRVASKFRGTDVPFDSALAAIHQINRKCSNPLSNKEVISIVENVYKRYDSNPENTTDLGNAKRMVSQHGNDIRYIIEFNKWIYWANSRWWFDEDGHLERLAKNIAISINHEAADTTDDRLREQLRKHARHSESLKALKDMVNVTRTEHGIPLSQCSLDQNPLLLGVQNGVIDLYTGTLQDNSCKDAFVTKQASVEFDPMAKCHVWKRFLNQILGDDSELISYIKRAVGYSLTGSTDEQVLFFLYGIGANGKSTFVNLLQDLLGDYSQQSQVATFMKKGNNSINNDVARLRGSRFVATTETEEGSRFDESSLKQLTGGDMIAARFLHQEYFEFRPAFKLWISGNHKPYIKGNDVGIWRRIKLIPFDATIQAEDQDKHLLTKLRGELPGILNWCIEGCLQWQQYGLGACDKVDSATSKYKVDMDIIQSWIKDCCEADVSNSEGGLALFSSYKDWAKDNNEWVMSNRKFKEKLEDHGFKRKRSNKGSVYMGLRVVETNYGF